MDSQLLLIVCLFAIGMVSIIGFLLTKKDGFGRFNTSAFLLVLVLVFASMIFASGKLDVHVMANIFFAVIGFAGGLFTGGRPPAGTGNGQRGGTGG